MFTPNKSVKIGSRVRLRIGLELEVLGGKYLGPHDFTITNIGDRGWDLKDDEGRNILEALFVQSLFDIIEY